MSPSPIHFEDGSRGHRAVLVGLRVVSSQFLIIDDVDRAGFEAHIFNLTGVLIADLADNFVFECSEAGLQLQVLECFCL